MSRAGRSGESFALVLMDVNDLKQINDERGHEAGDVALIGLTDHLRALQDGAVVDGHLPVHGVRTGGEVRPREVGAGAGEGRRGDVRGGGRREGERQQREEAGRPEHSAGRSAGGSAYHDGGPFLDGSSRGAVRAAGRGHRGGERRRPRCLSGIGPPDFPDERS